MSETASRYAHPVAVIRPGRRLTLLGRSIVLILLVVGANATCWALAGLSFSQTDSLLNLAFLAWTLGLRHGLDADHISAIDNATRHLVSLGQLPITCGLWFSLGHSTIVILVNIAIAISVDIYDRLDYVGEIGGTVGTAISATFLLLIAVINIIFLHQAIKEKQRVRHTTAHPTLTAGDVAPDSSPDHRHSKVYGGGLMVRLIGPVLKTVDAPWKLYPVGILFGLGFDTASSIALLAISAIAQRGPNGESISHARIIVLPFLFTAGMSFVDSLDSVLMLYAYASPSRFSPEGKIGLFQATTKTEGDEAGEQEHLLRGSHEAIGYDTVLGDSDASAHSAGTDVGIDTVSKGTGEHDNKAQVMSSLSITLTALSIIVALSISIIEIMSLTGEKCRSCKDAAEAEDGGGAAGAWWRAWAFANDQSGIIGVGIVGSFVLILVIYHGGQWVISRRRLAA